MQRSRVADAKAVATAISADAAKIRQALVTVDLETPMSRKCRGRDENSTCEQHFITIDGFATVAYLPGEKLIGLSKINRIVRFFAQRPLVQERLTRQILVARQTLLDIEDATHYCVKARGVMDAASQTSTSALAACSRVTGNCAGDFLLQHRLLE